MTLTALRPRSETRPDRFGEALGASPLMLRLFEQLRRVAATDLSVLITGETGTGKDVIARSIHQESRRAAGPLVVLDCGAVGAGLIESTLFGHERGAFTGAVGQRRGCFEEAHGGTVFLDEVGELPLDLQPKLLRVLENRVLRRVGGMVEVPLDVRLIAATNRDLARAVAEGRFREDLFFRLAVFQATLPPLRDRPEDLPLLAEHFLAEHAARLGLHCSLSVEAIEVLLEHDWPGNLRELRNLLERVSLDGGVIQADRLLGELRLEAATPAPPARPQSYHEARVRALASFEREYFQELLSRHDGNISRSAHEARLSRYRLRQMLRRVGLY